MKKNTCAVLLALVLCLFNSQIVLATNEQGQDTGTSGIMQEGAKRKEVKKFDLVEIKKKRAEFLKKELNLTPKEEEAFIPLVNELMDKKIEINREVMIARKELKKNLNKTDADYQKVVDLSINAQLKEAQLQKEYFEKFKKVLPAEKIYKYQRAEKAFAEKSLEQHRQRKNSGKR